MYFDCFSGAAGDMVLGALLDAGVPLDALRAALGSLEVDHEVRVSRVLRAGISANHVQVVDRPGHQQHQEHAHSHAHDHGHRHGLGNQDEHHHHHAGSDHGHRSLKEIEHLIGHSALSASGKARAVRMFRRLAEAEAAIHEMPVEEVHLHEVGAVDSIIDIVGAVFALEWLGIDDIVSSALNVGGGTVEIAHGTFPIPAPATLRLLSGVPMYSSGTTELVTPTGALIISEYARSFGPLPSIRPDRVGYGAGTRDLGKVPNVLRVVIGERVEAREPLSDNTVLKIECEIDDMNPQLFGPVVDQLFGCGALDAFLTPIVMKKGRPGTLVTVLCRPGAREAISAILFRETTTIGVRMEMVERETLERDAVDVTVEGGSIRMKIARRNAEIVNVAPEFEDCVRVARTTGRPIKVIQAEAMRAWQERPASTR